MLKAGIINDYDAERRVCTVRIPGITDGSRDLPEAEFCYNIGDKSEHTEIEILKGDRVWLMFEDNNPMRPVIVGFRPRHNGNVLDWRRWHQKKIEISASSIELRPIMKIDPDTGELVKAGETEEATGELNLLTNSTGLFNSDGELKLSAANELIIECGGSRITMTPSSVKIDSPRIDLN